MDLVERMSALLERETVGRVYLEEPLGGRVQVQYGKRMSQREPMLRFRGRVYHQADELVEPDGTRVWVYRTTETAGRGGTDPWLRDPVTEGEAGWVHPVDWPVPPDPAVEAYAGLLHALAAVEACPAHAALAARLTAALEPPVVGPVRRELA